MGTLIKLHGSTECGAPHDLGGGSVQTRQLRVARTYSGVRGKPRGMLCHDLSILQQPSSTLSLPLRGPYWQWTWRLAQVRLLSHSQPPSIEWWLVTSPKNSSGMHVHAPT